MAYLDKAGTTWLISKVKSLLSGKVDAVEGKGLSTNDYTDEEKAKLEQKAPIISPTFTGSPKAPTPAKGNNSTQIATTAFVTTAVGEAVADIAGIKFEVVTALPSAGVAGTIYLKSNNGSAPNSHDEYIWVNSAWEKIGTTDVDLSGYLKKTDMVAITNAEIDAMFS